MEYLAENLRKLDEEEVLALGVDVLSTLEESAHYSETVYVIDVSGKPAGILGAATYRDGKWALWMLGTDEITQLSRQFLRYSKPMIRRLFDETGAQQFFNYTYAKNKLHHRWLEWCGADLGTIPQHIGPHNKAFLPFTIQKEAYV